MTAMEADDRTALTVRENVRSVPARPKAHTAKVRRFVVVAVLAAAEAAAMPVVARFNLISVSPSLVRESTRQSNGRAVGLRLLDAAVGTRASNGLGVLLAGSLVDVYEGFYEGAVSDFGSPIAGAGCFWRWPAGPGMRALTAHAAGYLAVGSAVRAHRVAIGASATWYVFMPEVEFYWVREYQPDGGRTWAPTLPKSLDYIGVAFRFGLGGWWEFPLIPPRDN
jgi:hypothetical protein